MLLIGWHLVETIQFKTMKGDQLSPFFLKKGEKMSFVREYNLQTKSKHTKEEIKKADELRERQKDEDSKMVTGIFKNIEAPKGSLTFTYRKYKEEPYRTYEFQDGHTYTVPLGVAKHINNMTAVAERDYARGPDGKPLLQTIVKSKRQRYQFLSTEFM